MHYSITSSTRASNIGVTARPSERRADRLGAVSAPICLTAGIVLQIAVEETLLQFRISSSELTRRRYSDCYQNISLCLSDHHDAPALWKRTADFVYIRGHGPGGRYKGHYRPASLADWSRRIRSWKKQGSDVSIYFDNDQKSAAPADALKLA
jgi:uncharacterized protein YecE (DUF72 family)